MCFRIWDTGRKKNHYKTIMEKLGRGAYLKNMEKTLKTLNSPQFAFFKNRSFKGSAKDTQKGPFYPKNLHVKKSLFPNDTVQSPLPEPGWFGKNGLMIKLNLTRAGRKKIAEGYYKSISFFDESFKM
ncbi:MAG: hypothetical protein CM15mP58_07460 [Burkholderiaceae bacterium]|nr:MAG: hypothetical protein CM15mP58_07460 [Burkholderiaceae bacterium]